MTVKHGSDLCIANGRRGTNSVVYVWWEILATTELISLMVIL